MRILVYMFSFVRRLVISEYKRMHNSNAVKPNFASSSSCSSSAFSSSFSFHSSSFPSSYPLHELCHGLVRLDVSAADDLELDLYGR